jgi:hypothetical protein
MDVRELFQVAMEMTLENQQWACQEVQQTSG